MLVLTRKQNQEIVIGDNIKVTVLKVKGNTVRLGIDAPRHVRVVRGELPPVDSETAEASAAEVTLVFSDSDKDVVTERTRSSIPSKTDSPTRLPGLQKSRNRLTSDRINHAPAGPEKEQTIRFKDHLPATLQHNRLKQIVSEISRAIPQQGR